MAKKAQKKPSTRKSRKRSSSIASGRPKTIARTSKRTESDAIEVIARGVLIRGQSVLLCENVKHGYFYLPGGHVEFSESAAAALQREFLEESGQRVAVGRLAMVDEGVFETKKRTHHEINLVFHVELESRGQEIRSKEPGIAFRWADLAAVPELDIRPVSAKAFLAAGASGGEAGAPGAEWVSAIK